MDAESFNESSIEETLSQVKSEVKKNLGRHPFGIHTFGILIHMYETILTPLALLQTPLETDSTEDVRQTKLDEFLKKYKKKNPNEYNAETAYHPNYWQTKWFLEQQKWATLQDYFENILKTWEKIAKEPDLTQEPDLTKEPDLAKKPDPVTTLLDELEKSTSPKSDSAHIKRSLVNPEHKQPASAALTPRHPPAKGMQNQSAPGRMITALSGNGVANPSVFKGPLQVQGSQPVQGSSTRQAP